MATDVLQAIQIPILMVGGDRDIVIQLERSQTITTAIPVTRLEIVEHLNNMDFPGLAGVYHAAIIEFVGGLVAGQPMGPEAAA